MARLFGKEFSRQELTAKLGSISQLGGVRKVVLAEGKQAGCEAALFNTGSGLNFTVLLGRGMDISSADYCGQSLCWRSPTGDVHSSYYNPDGLGWLQSFYGGLLVTCGLSWAGAPCLDPIGVEGGSFHDADGQWQPSGALGLHGRVSHIPAQNVWVDGQWEGDEYVMWAQGKVRESMVFGPNFILERKIWAKLGENKLWLRDVVRNEDAVPRDHMMLYHCNLGFPLVDVGAKCLFPSLEVRPRDEDSAAGLDDWATFPGPTPGIGESVYYHDLACADDGSTLAGFANPDLGLGICFRYSKHALPYLGQWKMPGAGTYVTGIEPATCLVEGRPKDRDEGRLIVMEPGEERVYELEIEVLVSGEGIEALRAEVEALTAL